MLFYIIYSKILLTEYMIESDKRIMKKSSSSNWKIEFKKVCKILKNNGVDIQKIPTRKTLPNRKRVPITLKDINIDGIDIEKIVKENGLAQDFPIGYYMSRYRYIYNQGNLTQEECKEVEELGIVIKRNEYASKPIFKGRKLSQFHLDYINGILDKILNGQINTKEALKLLNKTCIENEETIINDEGSIKRCVELLLKDRPEEIKSYHEMLRKNSGRRNLLKGKKEEPEIGLYHEKELEFKQNIIKHYLPLIIGGRITLDMVEKETSCTQKTINKIVEEFYNQNNDLEGLERYQEAKKRNIGASLKAREDAKRKRKEVASYKIVTNREFKFLSPEEQEEQLIMKIKMSQLKEEQSDTSSRKSVLVSDEKIKARIDSIMDYFKNKNIPNSNEVYFSDFDIRYMIFRYVTLINRTAITLDEKIRVLTSYDEIDEKTAYRMIKDFPSIMGYEASRTEKQLNLLEQENLIDSVISRPRRFMLSVNLMYALIQYAKERHNSSDLSKVNRSNIFASNATLKRLYGTSSNEIKSRYPYIDKEDKNEKYTIHPDEIGKATYTARAKSSEAGNALNQAMRNNEKGIK